MRWMPNPGWPERGGYGAIGHGNSVPRFHLTWGLGPGVLEPFVERFQAARARGRVTFAPRHRVDELTVSGGAVTGVSGAVLEPSGAARGQASSRTEVGGFTAQAGAVLVTAGGIGGNLELVRANWPQRLGTPPADMICGVPAHVDGRMLAITQAAGGNLIGSDRMWHYTEGIENWSPIWPAHGIRIIPAPSSLWLDATGKRLPPPRFPGFDTLGTLAHIAQSGHEHTWFLLTQRIIEREFALSGSEQNPDIASKSVARVLRERLGSGAPAPIDAFMRQGADFAVDRDLRGLVTKMNAITGGRPEIAFEQVEAEVVARDRELANPYAKDAQIAAIHEARRYLADRLTRVAAPHRLLDPDAGPLIAVRLHILTRKTLGGLQTDLEARVLDPAGQLLEGLWAAGEAAGFGGGGMHGYNSLEGTFLGGCLFSGRIAGRSMANNV
jgi:predicted oxidoreductase